MSEAQKWTEEAKALLLTDGCGARLHATLLSGPRRFSVNHRRRRQCVTSLRRASYRRRHNDVHIRAVELLDAAARQEYVPAFVLLARCFKEGKGTLESEATALQWLREGAKRKDAACLLMLGELYRDGKLIEARPSPPRIPSPPHTSMPVSNSHLRPPPRTLHRWTRTTPRRTSTSAAPRTPGPSRPSPAWRTCSRRAKASLWTAPRRSGAHSTFALAPPLLRVLLVVAYFHVVIV